MVTSYVLDFKHTLNFMGPLRKAATKSSVFKGRAIKEGGGGREPAIKEKKIFKNFFFRRPKEGLNGTAKKKELFCGFPKHFFFLSFL